MDGQKNAPLNVAVYCKAGFSKYALEIQKQRATAVIQEHDDWKLVATYTDFSTGPQFNMRRGFKMMMADCRKGLIDIILVKSIGVTIRFLDENIDTEADSRWIEFLNIYSALSAVGREEAGAVETSDIVPALQ